MDNTQECTTSARDWAMLIITIISMNVSWWIYDIPLLWTHGFQQYLSSVTWQSFRVYTPSCAALYALLHARTPEEEPYIYYVGPFFDDPSSGGPGVTNSSALGQRVDPAERPTRSLTRFQTFKALSIDSLTIIATGLTVSRTMDLPADYPASGYSLSLWVYPTLPVALLGVWHLICGTWIRWRRRWTFCLGMLIAIAAGAAVITPVAVLSPAARKNGWWIGAIVGYAIMALPVLALIRGPGFIVAIGLGFIFRVGGIGFGSLTETAFFPFCELKNRAFGATYFAIGALGAVLAVAGFIKYVFGSDWSNNPRNRAMHEPSFGDGLAISMPKVKNTRPAGGVV